MKKISKIVLYILIITIISILFYIACYKPTINLKGRDIIILKLNDEYKECGYNIKNKDNAKVMIKGNVDTKKIGVYEIKYILYSKNNVIVKKRKVKVVDNIPPKIELNGSKIVYVLGNDEYIEQGFKATDNYDGDITNLVKVVKENDKIIYRVTDTSGNESVVERTIKIRENNNGIIYLTFDDGPSYITNLILDILKEENVSATFFILNYNGIYNDTIKRINDEGHTIGLHSYTHNYKHIYSSTSAYFDDLEKLQSKVKETTNKESKIIRFPGGSSNTISSFNKGIMSTLTNEVLKKGYHYFDWDIDSMDSSNARNSNEVYNNVIYNLSKNRSNVVLMHDFSGNYKTVNALRNIIRESKKRGYTFSNITYNTPMIFHKINN